MSVEIVKYTDSQTDKDLKHQYLKCILLTLKELSAVIAMKVGVILLVTIMPYCTQTDRQRFKTPVSQVYSVNIERTLSCYSHEGRRDSLSHYNAILYTDRQTKI